MPGAANAEQSIMGNQANTVDAINRNSQSGAQALSLITGAQGNTNEALKGLATQQEQFSYNAANNLQSVLGTFADNTFQGQLRKQMLAIQQKNALGLASTQNMGSGMNDVLNGVMASTNAGGFGKYGGTTPPAAAHG
jgi:hypothetical protein